VLSAAYAQQQATDAGEGGRIFAARCAVCHGAAGEGGRGPTLRPGRSDRELAALVRTGIPGSEMPAAGLPEAQLAALVAFVQELAPKAAAAEVFRGDAVAGKTAFVDQGCAVCHTIHGEGVAVGPDLSNAGARSARYLKESVLNPNAYIAPEYRGVAVTTADGKTVHGILAREDERSVEVRDMSGRTRSFVKAEVRKVEHETESPMPAFTMPSTDLDNIVAYLSTLRARR